MYGLLVGIEVEGGKVTPLDFVFQHHFSVILRNGHIIFHVGFQIVAGYRSCLVAGRVPVCNLGPRVPYDFPGCRRQKAVPVIPATRAIVIAIAFRFFIFVLLSFQCIKIAGRMVC